jgi:hypothetical protein
MEYWELNTNPETCDIWLTSSANELGWLAQWIKNRYPGTNTIHFIPITEVPQGHSVMSG